MSDESDPAEPERSEVVQNPDSYVADDSDDADPADEVEELGAERDLHPGATGALEEG